MEIDPGKLFVKNDCEHQDFRYQETPNHDLVIRISLQIRPLAAKIYYFQAFSLNSASGGKRTLMFQKECFSN